MTFENENELDEALSRPNQAVLDTLSACEGDFVVLGAAGKMGPTLCRMLRRGLDALGKSSERVIAVSRFSQPKSQQAFHRHQIETHSCDLLHAESVRALPDAANVFYLAGQKFGTRELPELTWAMNTLVPALVAQRYAQARQVIFSTGCVYPLLPLDGPGADEDTPLTPPGEYANSCVGRERIFSYFSREHDTPMLFFRLCYAIDLRYGVLHDIAQRLLSHQPIELGMGAVHVIWQGDANARAIQCLTHTQHPPPALNVTGLDRIPLRALTLRLAEKLGVEPTWTGEEKKTAWIWDAQRSYDLLGPPEVTLDSMIEATAHWHLKGGSSLHKPTHFEVHDGGF